MVKPKIGLYKLHTSTTIQYHKVLENKMNREFFFSSKFSYLNVCHHERDYLSKYENP